MVAYTKQEMVGITELSKSLSSYLEKVVTHSVEKLAVIRHNKPEAVILPIAEYERMKALSDYLGDLAIAQIIKERVLERSEPAKMITAEEMNVYLKERGCNV